MHVKHLRSARAVGFHSRTILQPAETPITWRYLRHKSSFVIASLALVAFVAGNIIGKNGFNVFMKSIWADFDDSLIVYEGTVPPLEQVVDFGCWARTGGDSSEHTWRQVPMDCRIPLPRYAIDGSGAPTNDVYSVGYMGDYNGLEGHGSHPGIDIRVPTGTPVVSVMNGIVTEVGNNAGGFGKFVVVRHPHVPDPSNPKSTTTLFSAYAHLSAQLVSVGDVVDKGQEIGFSGRTGNVSGPHLHYQLDRETSLNGEEAPFHPYWPFDRGDMTSAGVNFHQAVNGGINQSQGYAYTVHPLQYVQSNFAGVTIAKKQPSTEIARVTTGKPRIVAMAEPGEQPRSEPTPRVSRITSLKSRAVQARETRTQRRLSAQRFAPKPVRIAAAPSAPAAPDAVGAVVEHDGSFVPGEWKEMRVTLVDADGNATQGSGLHKPLYLRTAFGYAQFDPPVLTSANFIDGEAVVRVLPQGMQTVVVDVKPFGTVSKPMKYAGR